MSRQNQRVIAKNATKKDYVGRLCGPNTPILRKSDVEFHNPKLVTALKTNTHALLPSPPHSPSKSPMLTYRDSKVRSSGTYSFPNLHEKHKTGSPKNKPKFASSLLQQALPSGAVTSN